MGNRVFIVLASLLSTIQSQAFTIDDDVIERHVWINNTASGKVIKSDDDLMRRIQFPRECTDVNLKNVLTVLNQNPKLERRIQALIVPKDIRRPVNSNSEAFIYFSHFDLGVEVKQFRRDPKEIFGRATGSAIVFQPVGDEEYLPKPKNQKFEHELQNDRIIVYGKTCTISQAEIKKQIESEIARIRKLRADHAAAEILMEKTIRGNQGENP